MAIRVTTFDPDFFWFLLLASFDSVVSPRSSNHRFADRLLQIRVRLFDLLRVECPSACNSERFGYNPNIYSQKSYVVRKHENLFIPDLCGVSLFFFSRG